MTPRTILTTAALLAGALVMTPARAEEAPPADEWGTQVVVEGNNALAIQMYQELVAGGEVGDNVFFSPMSISSALALTYEGARGATMTEFEQVLGASPMGPRPADWGRPQYHQAMGGVLGMLDGDDKPYELAVANALWGERSMPFAPQFVNELNENYDAGLEPVDFRGDAENQRIGINDWVAQRTHDRIQDLLPAGSLDAMTRLVLVNAIYFKAEWATKFNERMTEDAEFLLPPADADGIEALEVPMMRHHEKRFRYADLDGFAAIELPYRSGDLSMVVLLPDDADGLTDLEAQLSPAWIEATLKAMQREHANVWLPKWEMTLDYDLIPALQAMGLATAFDANHADFTGISDSADGEELYITGVFHKAFIAVDEDGTEAAAATAVAIGVRSAPQRPDHVVDFRADHPFIYLIRDTRSGAILFMGRVIDPS